MLLVDTNTFYPLRCCVSVKVSQNVAVFRRKVFTTRFRKSIPPQFVRGFRSVTLKFAHYFRVAVGPHDPAVLYIRATRPFLPLPCPSQHVLKLVDYNRRIMGALLQFHSNASDDGNMRQFFQLPVARFVRCWKLLFTAVNFGFNSISCVAFLVQ